MPAVTAGGGDAADVVAARVLADLLAQAHLMAPSALNAVLAERARPLGVRIYLADLQQRHLHLLLGDGAHSPASLSIDSTLAGRAFQTVTIHRASAEAAAGSLVQLWVPLVDGTERLGVLELVVEDAGEAMLGRYRTLASLAGLLIASKSVYSDTYARVRRTREVALQAEMVWGFMAPATFATEQVIVSAVLEPAYEVGGDAYDHSLLGEHLQVSIFDAAGHDLAAGLIASVAMASSRTTRRSGGGLTDIAVRADHAIASQFGDSRFATALLCDLNIATGELTWIPCGHPPPPLIRHNKVIKELFRPPWAPLGIADTPSATASVNGDFSPPEYRTSGTARPDPALHRWRRGRPRRRQPVRPGAPRRLRHPSQCQWHPRPRNSPPSQPRHPGPPARAPLRRRHSRPDRMDARRSRKSAHCLTVLTITKFPAEGG